MASDDTMTINSSMHEGEDEDDDADDDEDQPLRRYSMSRLSICTSNSNSKQSMDDDVDDDMMVYMSRLYVENESEVEADGELSDEKEGKEASIGTDDSDKEATGWFSLPSSPHRRIRRGAKEYKSENDEKGEQRKKWRKESRKLREKWLERTWEMRKCKAMDEEAENNNNLSGESESVVIATPKGGRRSLCMDMEEVKACRDLGFDFQHEWTVEVPHVRISSSTADTDSGGNSPISNWRISSPGDDPKDVKARLKVWAQAVALASTSRLNA